MDKLAYIGLTCLVVATCYGADFVWTGKGGDNEWGNPENWTNSAAKIIGVPGEADMAVLVPTAMAATTATLTGNRVRLGANRTVNILGLRNTGVDGNFLIVDGEGEYSLKIMSGTIQSSGSTSSRGLYTYLMCDVIIGANATWGVPTGSKCALWVGGSVSDEGNGYSLSLEASTYYVLFAALGTINIGGEFSTQLQTANFGVPASFTYTNETGIVKYEANGKFAGAVGLYVSHSGWTSYVNSDYKCRIFVDNDAEALNDRLPAETRIGAERGGGHFYFRGNTDAPVRQEIEAIELRDSSLALILNDATPTRQTTDLVVGTVIRNPCTFLVVQTNANSRVYIQDAVNVNGMWQPWCTVARVSSEPAFSQVDEDGLLVPKLDDVELPSVGGSDEVVYKMTAETLALTGNVTTWALRLDKNKKHVLSLGDYDLFIKSGALHLGGNGGGMQTIDGNAGRLVFGGDDVIILPNAGRSPTNEISVALAWEKPVGSSVTYPNLMLPVGDSSLRLSGRDDIGHYNHFMALL